MNEPVPETPNHVPCRHCGHLISWDEICWTHDDSGFADCGLTVSGGRDIGGGVVANPDIVQKSGFDGKRAEPVGDWK